MGRKFFWGESVLAQKHMVFDQWRAKVDGRPFANLAVRFLSKPIVASRGFLWDYENNFLRKSVGYLVFEVTVHPPYLLERNCLIIRSVIGAK